MTKYLKDFKSNIATIESALEQVALGQLEEQKNQDGFFIANNNILVGSFVITLCAMYESYNKSIVEAILEQVNSSLVQVKATHALLNFYAKKSLIDLPDDEIGKTGNFKIDGFQDSISINIDRLEKVYKLFGIKIKNLVENEILVMVDEIKDKRHKYAHDFNVLTTIQDIRYKYLPTLVSICEKIDIEILNSYPNLSP